MAPSTFHIKAVSKWRINSKRSDVQNLHDFICTQGGVQSNSCLSINHKNHTAVKQRKYFKFESLSIFGLLGATSEKSRGGTGEGLHSHMGSQNRSKNWLLSWRGWRSGQMWSPRLYLGGQRETIFNIQPCHFQIDCIWKANSKFAFLLHFLQCNCFYSLL